MKNLRPGRQYTRRPAHAERKSASRPRFSRFWSLRGCVLDVWQWMGGRRQVRRPIPYHLPRYVEISLADWAVRS